MGWGEQVHRRRYFWRNILVKYSHVCDNHGNAYGPIEWGIVGLLGVELDGLKIDRCAV